MENRVALVSVIVKNPDSVKTLNDTLHAYSEYIIGRMGLPYKEKRLHIISIAIDAPLNVINALSGKIGRIDGISSKVAYANE